MTTYNRGVEWVKRIIKFEVGILLGTLFGATVSAGVCSVVYEVLGYEAANIITIQQCMEESLNE